MKSFFIVVVVLYANFFYPQLAKESLNNIINETVDSDAIKTMRALAIHEMLDIEKEGFLKDYDSLSNEYYNAFKSYYEEKYTSEEIKALHNFYQSNAGKKVSGDLKQLFKNNLPVSPTLEQRLNALRAKSKQDVQTTESATTLQVHNISFEYYLKLIGFREYLNIVQDYEVMWIEPQYENKYRKSFPTMTAEYITDIYHYFNANYTQSDMDAIKEFYHSALGKKVVANAGVFASITFNAYQKWVDGFSTINGKLIFGKYQK